MSAIQRHQLPLEGCSPVPLVSYLKALGVLRVLGEQHPDWNVRGAWRADRFVLSSAEFTVDLTANRAKLLLFFLGDYRPASVVAPWNGGSGFYPKDNRSAINVIASSSASRFSDYRIVIEFCRQLVRGFALNESPKDAVKAQFLSAARSEGPDALLPWMDAAVLLAGDEPRYPPLLGTGGNDGRLDFTNNFMQRLLELFEYESGHATELARACLPAALFGEAAAGAGMAGIAIGQFHPGGAGGPNATVGFEGESVVNPWDFVLMLEGALFFAAAATRRLEASEPGMLGYPFTVRAAAAGNGSIGSGDEGQSRAEIWLPLWRKFSSVSEIRSLLTEGRVTLGRQRVRDGLGFVRAVAALGVDRGISAFQRYGFLMRSGKAYLATPLTRVAVRQNPDTSLIDELEDGQFLDRLRRFAREDQTPIRIRTQVRLLEDAIFELAQRSEPRRVQHVLCALGAVSASLGKSRKGQDAVPPITELSEKWVLKSDDGSTEFRLAAAFAGLRGAISMRPFVLSVRQEEGRWVWHPESRLAVWGDGSFIGNMSNVIARRLLEFGRSTEGEPPFCFAAGVSRGDVALWLEGSSDDVRLSDLFVGLVNARIPLHLASCGEPAVLPAAYSVLKPFFTPEKILVDFELLPPDSRMSLPGELLSRLRAGRTSDAVDWAWRRLRAVGYPLPHYPSTAPSVSVVDDARMLVALTAPLEFRELSQCLNAITQRQTTENNLISTETRK